MVAQVVLVVILFLMSTQRVVVLLLQQMVAHKVLFTEMEKTVVLVVVPVVGHLVHTLVVQLLKEHLAVGQVTEMMAVEVMPFIAVVAEVAQQPLAQLEHLVGVAQVAQEDYFHLLLLTG